MWTMGVSGKHYNTCYLNYLESHVGLLLASLKSCEHTGANELVAWSPVPMHARASHRPYSQDMISVSMLSFPTLSY